jgi:AAA family ATP:ADP antiporter
MVAAQFLSKIFNVRHGEGRILSALLIHSLFMGIGIIFFYSAASAIFLIKFDAKTLPYAFIGSAFIVPVMGLLFGELEQRLPVTRLFHITLSFIFGSILVSWVLLITFDSKWLVFAIFIWAHVIFVLCYLEFWGLVGRCFNVRQGKRLFGLVGTGEVAATIFSGLAVPAIVEWVGTPNLLLGSAGGIGLCFLVLVYIFNLPEGSFTEEENKEGADEEQNLNIFQELKKSRYMTLITALWILSISAFYFLDFAFFQQAETRYSTEDELAGFFGILLGVAGVVTLLSRLFVSGPLLSRFGLTAGLLALPLTLTFGSGLVLLGNFSVSVGILFWMVIILRILDEVVRTSIEEPAKRVLYQPLPVNKRLGFQTLVEGLTEPLAGGLAGAILLILISLLDLKTVHVAFILFCIGGIWLGVVLALGKEYQKALLNALSKRTLGDVKVSLIDASSVEILKKGLNHSNPGVIVYCLNMLQEMEHPQLATYLIDLLDHSNSQIRLEALERIETRKFHSTIDEVRQRVEKEELTKIKGVALRVLCELDKNFSYEKVAPYVEDADPDIRKGVIVGLLKNGGIEETSFAENHLGDSILSPHWEIRLFVAQVLGEAGSKNFNEMLLRLMRDENLEVRKAALKASGKLKIDYLWPEVLKNLESPTTHTAAFSALISGKESVLPFLEQKFKENDCSIEFIIYISRICGQIGGDKSLGILMHNISYPIEEVRHQILLSLSRHNYQMPVEGKEKIIESIHSEIENAAWTLRSQLDTENRDDSEILKRALNQSWLGNRERVLLLLSLIDSPKEIHRIRNNLASPSTDQRAYALEALENVISKNIRDLILPVIDDLQPTERLQKLSLKFPQESLDYEERLAAIISRSMERTSPWTKACALYMAGKTDSFNHYDVIIDSLSSQVPYIRETAAWALHSLNVELFKQHAPQIKIDCEPLVKDLLKRSIREKE